MGDVINLRQARKERARKDKEAAAAHNRAAFGQSKADKLHQKIITDLSERRLDAHRLPKGAGDDDTTKPV